MKQENKQHVHIQVDNRGCTNNCVDGDLLIELLVAVSVTGESALQNNPSLILLHEARLGRPCIFDDMISRIGL